MRVALFSDFSQPQVNGIVHAVHLLSSTLARRGHTVRLFTIDLPGAPQSYDQYDVQRYTSIPAPGAWDWRLALPFHIMRDCAAFNPDVLHVHSAGTVGMRGCAVGRKLGKPVVGTSHTFPAEFLLHNLKLDFGWTRRMIRRMNSRYYNRCTLVTAASKAMLQELVDYGLRVPTMLVQNAVDTSVFRILPDRAALRVALGINRFTVVSCGRIVEEKHIDDTMRAFHMALQQGLDGDLLVIGDGPARPSLASLATKLQIADRIRFTGVQSLEQISRFFNAADAYMLTSRADNQSLTVLQAMACGLPVIAVRGGGTPEIVAHERTGILANASDSDALAAGLLRLQDTRTHAALSSGALQYIQDHHTPEASTAAAERAYREAMQIR